MTIPTRTSTNRFRTSVCAERIEFYVEVDQNVGLQKGTDLLHENFAENPGISGGVYKTTLSLLLRVKNNFVNSEKNFGVLDYYSERRNVKLLSVRSRVVQPE